MNNAPPAPVLVCANISRIFDNGLWKTDVLKNIQFSLAVGECVAIMGSSGSGKSTLLHILGGLDQPTTGTVHLVGQDLYGIGEQQRSRLRNYNLGFVYQFHHLLPEFSALENVAMPLLIRGERKTTALSAAEASLKAVGLGNRFQHKPSELSGGERQRAAIARALVTKPKCILADEPTGNLDRKTADQVFQTLRQLNQQTHTSLVIVTHDPHVARDLDSIYLLQDGELSRSQ